ncbi:PrsW family intramembrane metalloprotease [Humibacter ginsenosidimutans]|uniref:PrsW family intramembrane metalloprotease n=1 Tax=Humibacter ginsenosidimutans TaxID=2599293 RepID=A0A5B8LYR4_9MICO|nr:PrsW family intramembrane metalloprotease [Humibacter ginsenosidimutans]QDZ13477.1 PrsW family intramembrane metalloprotease [Humibacter ginsenosidimutans]
MSGFTPGALPPVPPRPRAKTSTIVWTIIGLILLVQLLVVVFAYLVLALGAGLVALSSLLALIPLAIVLLTATWIDAWEPEPWAAKLFALLWGAAAAITIALLFDLGQHLFTTIPEDSMLSSVVRAPLVEESAKGAALLILVFAARRTFDGPIDGVVYAAFTAGGFAFVENIQYFATAIYEGGAGSAATVFVLRALFSPFAHVLFTSCTGVALGLAARRRGVWRILGAFVVGVACAAVLHAVWNFAGYVGFWGVYLLFELPLFIAAVVAVVLLRVREQHLTRDRLDDYGRAGWFSYAEVGLYGTRVGRRRIRAWARGKGGEAPGAVRSMIRVTTRLAMDRQQIIDGSADPATAADEAALLAETTALRSRLHAIG